MESFILFIHFASCVLLIIVVLLQSGKGSATGIFGGSGGDMLFPSSSGMAFIKKFTIGLAAAIAITSLMLSVFAGRGRTRSVTSKYQDVPLASQSDTGKSSPVTPQSASPVSSKTPAKK